MTVECEGFIYLLKSSLYSLWYWYWISSFEYEWCINIYHYSCSCFCSVEVCQPQPFGTIFHAGAPMSYPPVAGFSQPTYPSGMVTVPAGGGSSYPPTIFVGAPPVTQCQRRAVSQDKEQQVLNSSMLWNTTIKVLISTHSLFRSHPKLGCKSVLNKYTLFGVVSC